MINFNEGDIAIYNWSDDPNKPNWKQGTIVSTLQGYQYFNNDDTPYCGYVSLSSKVINMSTFNQPSKKRYFIVSFTGEGEGIVWFSSERFPSYTEIITIITNKFPKLTTATIIGIKEITEDDFKSFTNEN